MTYKATFLFLWLAAIAGPFPIASAESTAPTAKDRLVAKLNKRDGKPSRIAIFSSSETTDVRLGQEITFALEAALKAYGLEQVRREPYTLPTVNMEEVRIAMARFSVDVLIATITKEGSVEAYLFDRRTPYNLFAHSESISEQAMAQSPQQAVEDTTRLLVRRLMFRYLNDHFYELPREESLPVIQAEIPQWIASPKSLELVNHEIKSRFYLNASLGAALSMGPSNQLWNSNLIGLQLGVRLAGKFYLEGQVSAFSYNAFVASLRYTFVNRNSPFRVNVGIGFGSLVRDKSWNIDQTLGLGRFSYYIVPSASLLFPIGRAYLKLEGQMFVSPSFNQYVWTFMPGIQIHF